MPVQHFGAARVFQQRVAQNLQQIFWDEEKVNAELARYMARAYRDVAGRAAEKKISLKQATYEVEVGCVARAEALRGLWPKAGASSVGSLPEKAVVYFYTCWCV